MASYLFLHRTCRNESKRKVFFYFFLVFPRSDLKLKSKCESQSVKIEHFLINNNWIEALD